MDSVYKSEGQRKGIEDKLGRELRKKIEIGSLKTHCQLEFAMVRVKRPRKQQRRETNR